MLVKILLPLSWETLRFSICGMYAGSIYSEEAPTQLNRLPPPQTIRTRITWVMTAALINCYSGSSQSAEEGNSRSDQDYIGAPLPDDIDGRKDAFFQL